MDAMSDDLHHQRLKDHVNGATNGEVVALDSPRQVDEGSSELDQVAEQLARSTLLVPRVATIGISPPLEQSNYLATVGPEAALLLESLNQAPLGVYVPPPQIGDENTSNGNEDNNSSGSEGELDNDGVIVNEVDTDVSAGAMIWSSLLSGSVRSFEMTI
jgi:hypothetical protein